MAGLGEFFRVWGLIFLFSAGVTVLVILIGWMISVVAVLQRKSFSQTIKGYFKAWMIHFPAMLAFVLIPTAFICVLALFPAVLDHFLSNEHGNPLPSLLLSGLLPFLFTWWGLAVYVACRDMFPGEETPSKPVTDSVQA